ncbi:MAG TPA: TolC family protein [Gammaproteobacteria bacterium]|nr:TolC family protein [Gammaproteobacteria bacterium]
MQKKGIILCLMSLLTACTITPKPIPITDRYHEAKNNLNELFRNQPALAGKLTFEEALARGLKYNLDYRIKQVNIALQAGQLNLAKYMMFPSLNFSGSLYTRNNDFSSSSVGSDGQESGIFNSTPRTLRTARLGLTWNVLDFGLSYVKARQQGERVLISEEESRKQLQQLSQEILLAYWNAYSSQQLVRKTRDFQILLERAKRKLSIAVKDKSIPKENLLNFQASLLEGNRRLIQLEYKYDRALLDLKHLTNLPLDQNILLEPPPITTKTICNLHHLDFAKIDAITLVSRPELRSQKYQERIAKLGIKAAILQALPGLPLNYGWNYNSNKYLLNTRWLDRSIDASWNLLNLISLPTSLTTARAQEEYEKLKLMALTLTVLTETRYAYTHYQSISKEYEVAHKQSINAEELYILTKNRERASLASTQQVILAKLRTITTKMDENLLIADLSTALGELYLSMGTDIIEIDMNNAALPVVTHTIKQNFALQNTMDLSNYVNNTYQELFGKPAKV